MSTAAMVSCWVVGTSWNLGQGFDEYVPLYQTERRPAPSSANRFLPLRAVDTSRAACRWLRLHADRPFMLWLHFMDPHQQYYSPPPFAPSVPPGGPVNRPRTPEQFLALHNEQKALSPHVTAAVRADYAGEVRYTDRCIGDVISMLRALGLEKNTLVVVAADHGEALNETDGYFGHTRSLAETVNRVPLILAGPRVGRGISNLPATLLDAAPTILSLLGIPAPDEFQGRNLAPFLPGAGALHDSSPNTLPFPLLFTRGENGRRAWLVDGMKATFDPEGRITTLHDLEQDPLEAHDLLEERPNLADTLARRYMVPYTELAAMAAEWANGDPNHLDAETARKLKELGYVKE